MITLENGDLSGMKSELRGFRDLSAFRHFEIGVFQCLLVLFQWVGGVSYLDRGKVKMVVYLVLLFLQELAKR